MSQQRQIQMMGAVGGNYNPVSYMDTTFTKLFVGGLAWETQRDTMRRYFEQFGDILEAVVITDKNTGRSKGYGFVTFRDPEAAIRACQNPAPVIDGRRTNCNLASFGAVKPPHPPTSQQGTSRFRPALGVVPPGSSSSYVYQPIGQYPFPYSAYGYAGGYSQETMYPPWNYYGTSLYGGQQISPYYSASLGHGSVFHNPFYGQYGQSSQVHDYGGVPYNQVVHYTPYFPQQQHNSAGILSLPSSTPILPTTTGITTSGTPTPTSSTATGTATGVGNGED